MMIGMMIWMINQLSLASEAEWTSMHLVEGLMTPEMLMVTPLRMNEAPLVHDPNKMVFPVARMALSV